MASVWLVTSGDGSDGDEWQAHGIFSTREKAEAGRDEYQRPRPRPDGTSYVLLAEIEEWDLDPPLTPPAPPA